MERVYNECKTNIIFAGGNIITIISECRLYIIIIPRILSHKTAFNILYLILKIGKRNFSKFTITQIKAITPA